MINWSIDVVKGLDDICDILVSTDVPMIAEIAKKDGALVPWLRPAELATDTATSVDVALHALDWYESQFGVVDGLMLLQPTSPFRTRETVHKSISAFMKNGQKPVLGVSHAKAHPMWCFNIDEKGVLNPVMGNSGLGKRSQDLPDAYVVNGCMYVISPDDLRASKSFVGDNATPLIVSSDCESVDIDTDFDWMVAEAMAHSQELLIEETRK